MIIGETFTGESGDTFYTPAFPRQGDGVTSTFEVIAISPDTKVTVSLESRNSEETSYSSNTATGTDELSAAGVTSFRNTGIRELVRYAITIEYTAGVPTAGSNFWVHYRILSPAWELSGAQSI